MGQNMRTIPPTAISNHQHVLLLLPACFQVLARLLPFARGLCHSYWAPNAWALYSFADKVAAAVAVKAGLKQPSATANMANGVVGVSSYVVLPNIGAGICAGLTLLALLPCLIALWKTPRQQAGLMFAAAVAYANLCGFMFGYHVHEKAALTVILPMVLAATRLSDWGREYVLLSTAAHVGIFPLLFEVQEIPIRWMLAAVYYMVALWGLSTVHGGPQRRQQRSVNGVAGQQHAMTKTPNKQRLHKPGIAYPALRDCCSWLPGPYRVYLAGLVVMELYCTLGHKALLVDKLPFAPLMLTSVYCSLAFTWSWGWMMQWFVQQCMGAAVTADKQE